MRKEFDCILFGNGMTINFLNQIKPYIPKEHLYILNIDDFLKKFANNKISNAENNKIYDALYNKKRTLECLKGFNNLKSILRDYYKNNDANIENILGRDKFKKSLEYDLDKIESVFPFLYNIWFILLYEYIEFKEMEQYKKEFYDSLKSYMSKNCNVYTTNFDYFSDFIIKTKHIHGKFLESINSYEDIILYYESKDRFHFKYIWGINGISKTNKINMLHDLGYEDSYNFNFELFYSEDFKSESMLIYGLSFQRSGYITENFKRAFPEYEDKFMHTFIDEHILWRIKILQEIGRIKKLVVTYYSDEEKEYLEKIFEKSKIVNIKFINCKEFDLSIETKLEG